MSDLPLPLDIFLEIFSRLPIKSLIRCKSVSKTWQFLTSHPLLPTMHLSHSSSSSSSQSLILYSKSNSKLLQTHLYFLDLQTPSPPTLQTPIKLNLPSQIWLHNFTIVGHCNGLLCLFETMSHSQDIYIYNPSTSDSFQLPEISPAPCKLNIGFGFEPKSGRYKVVKILTDMNFLRTPKFQLVIEVYTVGDSMWKCRNGDALYAIDQSLPGVYVNGAIHWKGYKVGEDNKYSVCVVRFDLASEEVGLLCLPCLFDDLNTVDISLVALGGCVSVLHLVFDRVSGFRIVVWVMRDYGVKESWVKQFVMNDSSVFVSGIENAKVLCFNENGEIVLICGGRQLVAYDPVRDSYRDLGFWKTPNLVWAVPHSGSLIPAAAGIRSGNQSTN